MKSVFIISFIVGVSAIRWLNEHCDVPLPDGTPCEPGVTVPSNDANSDDTADNTDNSGTDTTSTDTNSKDNSDA